MGEKGKDEEREEEVTLKSLTYDFLSSTSAHGLPRTVTEKTVFRRIFWAFVFTGAAVYFLIQVDTFVRKFLAYDVVVKTAIEKQSVYGFPAVTVCNMNKLKKSLLNGTKYHQILVVDDFFRSEVDPDYQPIYYNPSEDPWEMYMSNNSSGNDSLDTWADSGWLNDYLNSQDWWGAGESAGSNWWGSFNWDMGSSYYYGGDIYGEGYSYYEDSFEFDVSEVMPLSSDEAYMEMFTMSRTDDLSDLSNLFRPDSQDIDEFGHQLSDLVVTCSFDQENCNTSMFSKTYNPKFGACYTFNGGLDGMGTLTTTRYGFSYGLRMVVRLEGSEYLGMFAHQQGIRVAVHPSDNFVFPEVEGVNAISGHVTGIGVEQTLVRRKEPPYTSRCTEGSGMSLYYPGAYTYMNCQYTCLRSSMKQMCECVDTVHNLPDEIRCSMANITQVLCRQLVLYQFRNSKLACQANCRPSCAERIFKSSVSATSWPSPAAAPLITTRLRNYTNNPNLTIPEVQTDFGEIHVYLKSMDIFSMTQSADYPWESLLADFGGTLGLFIGLSVCTAVEVFEYVFDVLLLLICPRKKRKGRVNSISVTPAKKPTDFGASPDYGL